MSTRKSQDQGGTCRRSARNGTPNEAGLRPSAAHQKTEKLRQRLAQVEAELKSLKGRQKWLESALADQRHARQLLEAVTAATYRESIAGIRDVVRAAVPGDATVLVVSRGDDELVKLDGRRGWHFPQDRHGQYAGYHPADSTAAIEHLRELIEKGGQYLLLPHTAFWWLEHYRGFAEHLDQFHLRIWRDDRCAIYKLHDERVGEQGFLAKIRCHDTAPEAGHTVKLAATSCYSIVCLPLIDWDYRFQRPQQLMRRFASAGHPVFYVSHEFRPTGQRCILRPLERNLHEVSLRGSHFKVRQGMLDEDSSVELGTSLSALRALCSLGPTVVMVQSPFWWPLVKKAAAEFGWRVVYDCMDNHAGFATSHPLMVEQEKELLARADLVVASSAVLETEARKYNHNVMLIRNACDYEHFARVLPKPRGQRPVIGYYGAIAEWFDADLVADLAVRRPDWDLVMVGSTCGADLHRLVSLPNVSLPGEKPYAELPDWLARFDIAILPFKRTPLTEAANPVKAYEILASGRALVSVPLPEMAALQPLVRLAASPPEFEREIEAELVRPHPDLDTQRRAFAKKNTWRHRFEALSPRLMNLLEAPGRSSRVTRPTPISHLCSRPRA